MSTEYAKDEGRLVRRASDYGGEASPRTFPEDLTPAAETSSLRGDVVSSSVQNLMRQYAVILVCRAPRPERSVVAYSDENTLRDLLAEPSIISFGYRSREEAMASLDQCEPTGHAPRANLTVASVNIADRSLDQPGRTQPRFRCGFDLAMHPEFIFSLLQHSFAAAIAFFYSKNLLSIAIRAVISS